MASRKPLIVPDGRVFEDAGTGARAELSGDSIGLELGRIRSVGIDDLSAVEEHCINRVYDTVSHFIRFAGGGELRFAFSLAGELLELSGQGVRISIRDECALYFAPYRFLD